MADISDPDAFFTTDMLIFLTVFIGGCATLYWRLRNFLAGKNKEHIERTAKETAKTVIDQITKDNMISELNLKEIVDKELEKIHLCTKGLEDNVAKLDKTLSVHIAKSDEQSKALERVTKIVDSVLTIAKQNGAKME